MEVNNNRLYLMESEGEKKALLKLGIPAMVGMIVSALYNIVDAYFIGQLGTAQMGAISVVYPLGIIILGMALLFGSGVAPYLSKLLGEKKYKESSKYASTALLSSMGLGVILVFAFIIFMDPLLKILGATDTILPFAKTYALLFDIGLIFNLFNITSSNIMSAEGATTITMKAMLIGAILNILLDPIFIFVFNLGVRGAAIATLISRVVSTILYAQYMFSKKSMFDIQFKNFVLDITLFKEIFKIGVPSLVFQLLSSFSLSLTNVLASGYGDASIAALSVVTRMMSLWTMAIFGFLKGYVPFVGFNYGARNYARVRSATSIVLKWTTIFSTAVALIMIIFATPIMSAFGKSNLELINIGVHALIWNSIVFCGFGFQAVFSNLFLALGMAKEGGIISIGRQGIFFIPIILLLPKLIGLNGLIMAQALADFLSIMLVLILVKTSGVLKIFTDDGNEDSQPVLTS